MRRACSSDDGLWQEVNDHLNREVMREEEQVTSAAVSRKTHDLWQKISELMREESAAVNPTKEEWEKLTADERQAEMEYQKKRNEDTKKGVGKDEGVGRESS